MSKMLALTWLAAFVLQLASASGDLRCLQLTQRGQSTEYHREVDRTTGMQGNSHEQSSESIERIALGFHCSLRAHGCLPAASQPPSATPHAVHFGGLTHGLCHRAWDPSIRVETLCRLFYRRLRHQLEL